MLIPGPTVTVRLAWSISWIWFISLTSTTIPWRSGTAPSVSPVPPARGTTGIPWRLASLTTSEICSAEVGSTTALRDVVLPPVGRERGRHPGAVEDAPSGR